MRWFSSRREQVKSWLSLRILECISHSRSGLCACVFHTGFGGMCMSPCRLWPCMLSTVVCVCVILCPRWDFGFSPVLRLCKVSIVFIVSLGCRFTLFLGCFLVAEAADVFWGLLLSFFGYARAKNNSGVWLDLNCASLFVWNCRPVVFAFFTEL